METLMPEPHWNPGRWVWGLWAAAPTLAALGFQAWRSGDISKLTQEAGPLESAQAGMWTLSVLMAIYLVARLRDRRARWSTVLLGVVACLALAREMDLHTLLNPKMHPQWGIHYRIDWWLNPAAPLGGRLLGVGLFVVIALGIVLPVWQCRGKPDWSRARPRLAIAAAAFLGLGFVCDDLLRYRVPLAAAQLVEEICELLGAALFLCAVLEPESAKGPVPDEATSESHGAGPANV